MSEAVVLRVEKGQLHKVSALTIERPKQVLDEGGVVVVGTSCRYEKGGCVNGRAVLERKGDSWVATGFEGRKGQPVGLYVIHHGCEECSSCQVARG